MVRLLAERSGIRILTEALCFPLSIVKTDHAANKAYPMRFSKTRITPA
jgi:hypothetical protein